MPSVGVRLGSIGTRSASADVWFAWCGAHVNDIARLTRTVLAPEERDRVASYRSRGAAERYVVTRALLRTVLSERLGREPAAIAVSRTSAGKPVIADEVHFNLTHSGDLILLAVTGQRPVGVDVERRREVPRVAALEARWLTASERGDFTRLCGLGIDPSDAFLRVWSLKEARLKALGVGISGAASAAVDTVEALPLDELLASLSPHGDDAQYVGAIAFA